MGSTEVHTAKNANPKRKKPERKERILPAERQLTKTGREETWERRVGEGGREGRGTRGAGEGGKGDNEDKDDRSAE